MTKKLGLVLSSGAARGWAHVGALRALDEIGAQPDLIVGCSAGALVGGARLIGALDALETWANALKPLSALESFSLKLRHGGFIDAEGAFDAFRDYDRMIEDLPVQFATVACDLGTGEEVVIDQGSVVDAARASTTIPVVFNAVRQMDRWLVDGALVNPTPVSVARRLGADKVIAIDVNIFPRVLDRFDPPPPSVPAIVEPGPPPAPGMSGAVQKLIEDTQRSIERQLELAKARASAAPRLIETAAATAEIFQAQLAKARGQLEPADVLVTPDAREAPPTAFDKAELLVARGYEATIAKSREIETLIAS